LKVLYQSPLGHTKILLLPPGQESKKIQEDNLQPKLGNVMM